MLRRFEYVKKFETLFRMSAETPAEKKSYERSLGLHNGQTVNVIHTSNKARAYIDIYHYNILFA